MHAGPRRPALMVWPNPDEADTLVEAPMQDPMTHMCGVSI